MSLSKLSGHGETGNLTMEFQTMSQLGDTLKGIIQISKGSVHILDHGRVRGALIDRLAWTATFHEKGEMRGTARWIIKTAAPHLGITFHSPQSLCEALRENSPAQVKVPNIFLKGMVYDTARAIFRVAVQKEITAFLFKLTPSETGAIYPCPSQYLAVIAAAGIQEQFAGPLFIDISLQEKCRGEAEVQFSNETPAVICNSLSTSVREHSPKQTNNDTLSLEKLLWGLPTDTKTKICSEMEEKFTSLCDTLNIVQTKRSINEWLQPTESFFSIRDEIEAAGAERGPG